MYALRWPAVWPQVVAISLIGLGAASCTDSGRFADSYGFNSPSRAQVTGSIPEPMPSNHVASRPMPPVGGVSGGGAGMGSYQPANKEITGSVQPPPPPPPPTRRWNWEGNTAITVAPGETLEMIARRHHVAVEAIIRANHLSGRWVHAGQHLVIPRDRATAAANAYTPPRTRIATNTAPAATGAVPERNAAVHVVAPGETLNSIARRYGTSVMTLARANRIPPDTMMRVGQHLVVPGARTTRRAEASRHPAAANPKVAKAEPNHSAWTAAPIAPPTQQSPVKTAEPVGGLPSFRWPVHGRIIASFGPKPSGVRNDGIDLAVPAGTPIKAAEDGVVAYAGSELKGYGNLVLIRHSDGYVTAYAHASEILVKRGETVKRGQVIARAGETGNVKTPELHFEIRKGATPVDPAEFLKGA
jgi:murein DD-endopeptidase MepM/ murein hydrolase activator NlpD